ncbi:hypothetical protein DPMN_127436 [Dreissena polymorpha]|uniref:Uncharacterized protein n=1 Tax=Dreissena polymorpha TaxID=45954 RepID=A0A9D4GXM6_DREPO|nr:hypothetical protein DPMN_127436 [Dreissena polymorpha]
MLKLEVFASRIKDTEVQKGVPEKQLLEFAKLVQSYITGPEYRLNSVMLFEQVGSFSG